MEYIFHEEYITIKRASNSLVNNRRYMLSSSVTSETENEDVLDYY